MKTEHPPALVGQLRRQLARWKAAGGQQTPRLFVGHTRGRSPPR